jgi:hypothetical protein
MGDPAVVFQIVEHGSNISNSLRSDGSAGREFSFRGGSNDIAETSSSSPMVILLTSMTLAESLSERGGLTGRGRLLR